MTQILSTKCLLISVSVIFFSFMFVDKNSKYINSLLSEVYLKFNKLDLNMKESISLLLKSYGTLARRTVIYPLEKEPVVVKRKLFTPEELKEYNGSPIGKGLYLAIMGKVYDVEKGIKHYGIGGNYHKFLGKDASRAFVTGDFSENGLTDDIMDLSAQDLIALLEWVEFYNKEYPYKGKVIGNFYNNEGRLTEYHRDLLKLIEAAKHEEEIYMLKKIKYPPCNSEWSADKGSRVWCSKLSGGIERDWEGVPRQLFEPGSDSYRCACIQLSSEETDTRGNIKPYPGCELTAMSCKVYT